jgi:hypothetical protein
MHIGRPIEALSLTMRTVQFIIAGCLLGGAFLLLGKLFSGHFPAAPRVATWLFVIAWLLLAAGNMWVGVAKAGYSAGEELPILLLVFAVPAAVAIVVKWWFL